MRMFVDIFWVIVAVIGTIYSVILGSKATYKYIVKKIKTKSIIKRTILAEVKAKYFSPSPGYQVPRAGTIIHSASYRVELLYNEQLYILYNEKVFNSVNAGDLLEIILVEEVDKDGYIMNSYLEIS